MFKYQLQQLTVLSQLNAIFSILSTTTFMCQVHNCKQHIQRTRGNCNIN